MYHKTTLAKSVRLALTLGAATAICFGQAAVAQEEGESFEKISVTGSRIIRDEFASSSPISVFDQEDLTNSGVTNLDEFLKFVPAFTGFQLGATTNNGNAEGQRKVDMRGLGFNRTLVLINGRRHVGDVTDDGAVDLNAIPFSMVKRIEVLKDGASTIYGTDAIAGVVNIILHDDFEGIQLNADWGQSTEHGDATNSSIALLMGTASDKGSFTMALEYNRQEEMFQGDRDWGNIALFSELSGSGFIGVPGGSSNSRTIRGVPALGITQGFTQDATTGEIRNYRGATDSYNYAPVNALVTPNERWQFAANGKYELDSKTTVYAETLYTRRTGQTRLAPDASFNTRSDYVSLATGLEQDNDFVPASNPFNPFGVNMTDTTRAFLEQNFDVDLAGFNGAPVRINRRFTESGGRINRVTGNTFRMVTGLERELADGLYFDISYTYAQNEFINNEGNLHRFDRWEIAVTPELCAANPDCASITGPENAIDPFSDFGSITPEQMAFLTTTGFLKNTTNGQLSMLQANLSGELGELDGGTIGWAVGYESRREKGDFSPDEFLSEGLTTGGAANPLSGSFTVDEIYTEFYLPVSEDVTVDFSARYSDYDTVGNDINFDIGLEWVATDEIRVRGGYSTGFRAPNISELNQPEQTSFPVVEPYCEFADRRSDITQTMYDNCLAAVGGDVNRLGDGGELGFAWQSTFVTEAPPAGTLKPEESVSITLGVVYESESIEGLLVSLDYWNIEVDNLIGSPDMNDIYRHCLNSPNLSATSCDAFPRNSSGDPALVAFAASPPNSARSVFGNLGLLETSGLDFEAQYSFDYDMGLFNEVVLLTSGTYLMERTNTFALAGSVSLEGTADGFGVFPELRTNSSIRLQGEDLTVGWDIFYISASDDLRRPAEISVDAEAEAMVYHDLYGTYNFDFGSVTVGLNNVMDEDPPYFHRAFNANTDPGVYDVIGRRIFVNTRFTF